MRKITFMFLFFSLVTLFAQKNDHFPKKVEVKVNETFILTLNSNPTTGYQWQFKEPLNESILLLVTKEFKRPENKNPEKLMVGVGGQEIWSFKAIGLGKTKIVLQYIRPWEKKDAHPEEKDAHPEEKDAHPEEVVTVEVDVLGMIEVVVSEEFQITLKSNMSTGYHWELAEPLDETFLKLIKNQYEKETPPPDFDPEKKLIRIGVPGKEVWVFQALNEGESTISLKYVRSNEKEVQESQIERFHIKIFPKKEFPK